MTYKPYTGPTYDNPNHEAYYKRMFADKEREEAIAFEEACNFAIKNGYMTGVER